MNLLLCEENELQGATVLLEGRRARHILEILKLKEGETLRCGVIDGPSGTGRILRIGPGDRVLLETCLEQPPAPPPAIHLVLALPRPIMLQRILKQVATLGVQHIDLVRSRKVEKSFFQSPVLSPDKIHSLLVEGLEQAMATRLPRVEIHTRFSPFLEKIRTAPASLRLLAHPVCTGGLAEILLGSSPQTAESGPVMLAVGPEGGWTEHETESLQQAGFRIFSMGSRILHVDTAVVALLAQVSLLEGLRRNRCVILPTM